MPEWPAAEISLLINTMNYIYFDGTLLLLKILHSNLVSNITKKPDPSNNVLRMLSIELLGLIGARLRVEIKGTNENDALSTEVYFVFAARSLLIICASVNQVLLLAKRMRVAFATRVILVPLC